VATFVYADADGVVARQPAGLVPVRAGGDTGASPAAGWTAASRWRGFSKAGDAAGELDRGGNASLRAGAGPQAPDLLGVLDRIGGVPASLESIRDRLRARQSPQLEARLQSALRRAVVDAAAVPDELKDEVAAAIDPAAILAHPSPRFGADAANARQSLLVAALTIVASTTGAQPEARSTTSVTFQHPLAVFDEPRRRFNIGPVRAPGQPLFFLRSQVGDWDRTEAMNAPGQSGSPSSAHYDDLATTWANGEIVPLLFTADAVARAASDTLILQPR
jgi:hypothetical protein